MIVITFGGVYFRICVIVALFVLVAAMPASATTWTVGTSGCNYTNIQEAINSASAGDTILVQTGVYRENVNVSKLLTLTGIDTGGGKPVVNGGSSGNAMTLFSDYCAIEGFTITNSGTSNQNGGIFVRSNNNIITQNVLAFNENGIIVGILNGKPQYNTTILSNTFHNNDEGILLYHEALGNVIENNIFFDNGHGIELQYQSNNNLISTNSIRNTSEGVLSGNGCENNTISDNTIISTSYGTYGIHIYSSKSNIIRNNTIQSTYGMWFDGCTNHQIINNSITASQSGLSLYSSRENFIYLNNFNSGKNIQSGTSSTNTWNSTSPITYQYNGSSFTNYLGNFWNDYKGLDSNNDGIGDNPAIITQYGDYDFSPLVGQWTGSSITNRSVPITPTPTPTFTIVTTIPVTVVTTIPPPTQPWGILTLPNASIAYQTTKLIPIDIHTVNIPQSVSLASGVSFELTYNQSIIQIQGFLTSDAVPGSSIIANINNNNGKASVALTNVLGIEQPIFFPKVLLFINATAIGAVNESTPIIARNVSVSDSNFLPHDLAVDNGRVTIVVDVKGDFNHNGRVDIGDVAMVSYMVVNREPKLIPDADFNNNGDVDIGDAAKIAYYFVGMVTEL